jgi:oligoribonuclease NrnB/cAMP/cGMP phosphodiesterase (DHH superfamily)
MNKTYILHHNDPDGFGAAYSAYLKFGRGPNIEYIAVDYGRPMPHLEDGSDVYILDFSYPRNIIDSLVGRMKSVLVIDHHKSAMLDLEGHPNAIFDMNKSGAGLSWDYFSGGATRPAFINYIEDADLWRFALCDSKLVKNSIYQEDLTLEAYIAGAEKSIESRIFEGRTIQKVIDHNLQMGFDTMHTLNIDEFTMLAVNSCLHMSEFGNALFTKYAKEKGAHFAGVYYRYTPATYKFSLRSVGDFDVSVVCKRFGGGGHKNASGFELHVDKFNGQLVLSGKVPTIAALGGI